jgi:hypothetical protein
MVATGVPQYVKVLTELKEIKETVLATRSEIFAHVTARFDAIEKHIDGIGPSVADSLAENYKIDGHTPMTKVDQPSCRVDGSSLGLFAIPPCDARFRRPSPHLW